MFSLRKWLYKPKRTDSSLLAQFYYADESLCDIATELDSFDGRREPDRCARLVGQLRHCQDSVLQYIQRIMDEAIPQQRASRDFRVKYPDDLIQDGLSGQLWFGAECLAAGSSILNREVESASMRPLARSLTKHLDGLRAALRDLCLTRSGASGSASGQLTYSDKIKEGLVAFDRLFADFELSYVSAMVPVKTMKDYEMSQDVAVMFSEAVDRALRRGLVTQEALDNCDPALMFTIPRLAIVNGLVMTVDGPLNPDVLASNMSEMFRPFQTLLKKIRDLLRTLTLEELYLLERALCSLEDPRMQSLSTAEMVLVAKNDDSSVRCRSRSGNAASACSRCHCRDLKAQAEGAADPQDEGKTDTHSQARHSPDGADCVWPSEALDSVPARRSVSIQTEQGCSSANEKRCCRHHGSHQVTGGNAAAETSAATVQFAFWLPDRSDSRSVTVERSISYDGSAATTSASVLKSREMSHSSLGCPGHHNGDAVDRAGDSTDCSICGDNSSSSQGSLCSAADDEENGCDSLSTNISASVAADEDFVGYASVATTGCGGEMLAKPHPKQEGFVSGARTIDGRFVSKDVSSDLVHKLFVCISGVADQLQTNFASDLRSILKYVFDVHASQQCEEEEDDEAAACSADPLTLCPLTIPPARQGYEGTDGAASTRDNLAASSAQQQQPPPWVPDELHPQCSACKIPFTFVRRRHHCRNCGQIFCSRCSCNWAPLPNYGYDKPVRVCTRCFVYHIDPFAMDPSSSAATTPVLAATLASRSSAA